MAKGLNLEEMNSVYAQHPKRISFRNVINDGSVSWWTEWEDIKQDISMEDFFQEIRNRRLDPERLVAKAYKDESGGLLLDYGLRHQFYIPQINDTWDLKYLSTPLNERINKDTIKLKSCPFCGSEAKLVYMQEMCTTGDEGWVITCTNEDCNFSTTNINGKYSYNLNELAKKWNLRAK